MRGLFGAVALGVLLLLLRLPLRLRRGLSLRAASAGSLVQDGSGRGHRVRDTCERVLIRWWAGRRCRSRRRRTLTRGLGSPTGGRSGPALGWGRLLLSLLRRRGLDRRRRHRAGRHATVRGHPHPTLQAVDTGDDGATRVLRPRQQDARADELQLETRGRRPAHLRETGVQQIRGTGQLCGTVRPRLTLEPLQPILRHLRQEGGRGLLGGRDDEQVPEPLQQVLDEPARIMTGFDDPVDDAEHPGAVAGGERVDDVTQERIVRVAQQCDRRAVVDPVRRRTCDQLVQHRQSVADGPAACADDQRQHARAHLHALTRRELLQVSAQRLRRDQAERVVVGAGPDRADHLVRLRRREHELHVRRRLLHELEERVEALRRHHVRLIEDEDLVAVARRRVHGALAQIAGVIDTVVAGRVDLHDVQRAGAAVGQVAAALALPARGGRGPLRAVEAAGQDPGGRRLAAAAGAGEQEGMVDAPGIDRGGQRGGHMLLSDDLCEGFRTVAPIQCGGHAPTL